jgi:AraC family transcriptional regulator
MTASPVVPAAHVAPPGPFGPPLLTSGAAYAGALAAFHAIDAGELVVERCSTYRIAVHVGRPHRLWEWRDGASRDGSHRRGDVVVTAAGESRRVKWDRASSLVSVSLAPSFVHDAAAAVGANPDRVDISGCFSRRDARLEQLAFAILRELAAGLPSGPLLGESLAAAMAVRLVEGYSRGRAQSRDALGGLSPGVLSRVVAFMHESLAERVSLAALARVAGASPYHFVRQFRRSTGLPPHAYLVKVRVDEAARLLLQGTATPAEAAARVGFSNQGHLTRHMRRALGVTPGKLSATRRLA